MTIQEPVGGNPTNVPDDLNDSLILIESFTWFPAWCRKPHSSKARAVSSYLAAKSCVCLNNWIVSLPAGLHDMIGLNPTNNRMPLPNTTWTPEPSKGLDYPNCPTSQSCLGFWMFLVSTGSLVNPNSKSKILSQSRSDLDRYWPRTLVIQKARLRRSVWTGTIGRLDRVGRDRARPWRSPRMVELRLSSDVLVWTGCRIEASVKALVSCKEIHIAKRYIIYYI